MKFSKYILILLIATCFNCKKNDNTEASVIKDDSESLEQYRPSFHFTPKEKWMNDPNGLVYYNEYYHLFYQYYPDSTVWGPMHWGHAKSKDLIHWDHRPIALYPDSLGYIFSGSAVIDKENTAGFGENAMVAIYTYHDPVKEKAGGIDYQTQGIAYSLDEGETWTKYMDNPVVENPGIKDFRDPKVFWNEETAAWQMVLVAKDHVQIYESVDLKSWNKLSDFRFPDDPPLGVWECPDLFKLQVEDTNDERWVMIISHGGNSAPNGGSGTRYFIGDYDGKTFTTQQKESQWIDYGTDNYAGVTYNDFPGNERVFIGWMSNWNYATTTPTKSWRSAMTLPRKLSLQLVDGQYLIKSQIVESFDKLISKEPLIDEASKKQINFSDKLEGTIATMQLSLLEDVTIEYSNDKDESLLVGYKKNEGIFYIDRSNSGQIDFNENYANQSYQTMHIGDLSEIKIDIVLDASSIEVFINDGQYVMTNQVFPSTPYTNFKVHQMSKGEITKLDIKSVKSSL